MERGSSAFVKQAAILAGASIIVRFVGFLYRLPLTNLIGDEGNAYYNAGYQIYTFFFILSSAGLPAAISKMVSERIALKRYRDAHAVFRCALLIAAIAGIFCGLVVFFGARFLSVLVEQPLSYYSLIALSPTLVIVGVMAVFRGYFQGMNNTVPTAVSQIMEQIFNAVFSVILAYALFSKGVEFAAAGGTAGTGIGALAGLFAVGAIYYIAVPRIRKRALHAPRQKQSNKSIAAEVLKTALPIILGTAILSYSNLIDTLMISKCLKASGAFDDVQISQMFGQFSGKYIVLVTLPVSISTAMAAAVIPSIASSNAKGEKAALNSKINMGIRLSMLISIPAAVGLSVLGDQVIRLLFPNASEGGILLQWGAAGIIFLALAQIATGMLQGMGRVRIPVYGAVVGSIIKIPLNYLLISNPAINVVGAVISTMACYMAASVIDIIFLKKYTKIKLDFSGALLKPLLGSAIMGVACYIFYYTSYYLWSINALSTLIAVVAGIGIYFVSMLLLKGIIRSDLKSVPMGAKIIKIMDILKI
ncbi:MAG: polysaccharide biosynthesis protein [Clostridiales bacterium]|jgi:stage V sporulation protein B|nr:polysaccharide biosynthesis protein [Clostridiales bacterium]